MKRIIFIVTIVLTMASCTTMPSPEATAEYKQGRYMSREYAKKDAMDFDCFYFRLHRRIPAEAGDQYRAFLREQGKSEDFIRGFKWGYKSHFKEFIQLYCDI